MNIWITEIGEPLPLEKDVRLHRYGLFSKYLAQKGHAVTWWTSSFSHAPKIHLVDSSQDQEVDGYTLRLIKGPGYRKNVSWARIRHNKDFAKQLSSSIEKYDPPDVIICPIPVIEIADVMVRYGNRKNVPVLIDIRDEWPDELVNLAPAPLRPIAKLAFTSAFNKMKYVCRNASGILAISQRQMNYGLSFSGRDQKNCDHLFPLGYPKKNWTPSDLTESQSWLDENFDLRPYKLKCCFFGTMGRFFDLDPIFAAAKMHPEIAFVLAGDGDSREQYLRDAQSLKNVFLPGWVDEKKIQTIMLACDVGLAPYVDNSAFSMPNKVYEYLSGGLAVISSIQKEFKEVSQKYQVGLTYPPGDHQAFKRILEHLLRAPNVLSQMKVNAKNLFDNQFDQAITFATAENHIESFAKNLSTQSTEAKKTTPSESQK